MTTCENCEYYTSGKCKKTNSEVSPKDYCSKAKPAVIAEYITDYELAARHNCTACNYSGYGFNVSVYVAKIRGYSDRDYSLITCPNCGNAERQEKKKPAKRGAKQ